MMINGVMTILDRSATAMVRRSPGRLGVKSVGLRMNEGRSRGRGRPDGVWLGLRREADLIGASSSWCIKPPSTTRVSGTLQLPAERSAL
jgi:hypothetical protein